MNKNISIRTYKPGEPSLVCYFQYKLYEEQYHFNGMYEKEMLGSRLLAKFGFHKTESEFFNEWDESRDMYHETWECDLKSDQRQAGRSV